LFLNENINENEKLNKNEKLNENLLKIDINQFHDFEFESDDDDEFEIKDEQEEEEEEEQEEKEKEEIKNNETITEIIENKESLNLNNINQLVEEIKKEEFKKIIEPNSSQDIKDENEIKDIFYESKINFNKKRVLKSIRNNKRVLRSSRSNIKRKRTNHENIGQIYRDEKELKRMEENRSNLKLYYIDPYNDFDIKLDLDTELIFENKKIKYSTLDKLIETITSDSEFYDINLIYTFMLTYRYPFPNIDRSPMQRS
jgi:hypothetical protein